MVIQNWEELVGHYLSSCMEGWYRMFSTTLSGPLVTATPWAVA